jgi:hypothetical protein
MSGSMRAKHQAPFSPPLCLPHPVGMIWDLATGHVSAFDRMLSDLSEDDTPDDQKKFKR